MDPPAAEQPISKTRPTSPLTYIALARSAGLAIVVLLFSVPLVVTGLIYLSPEFAQHREDADKEQSRPWIIKGEELIARIGTGEPTADGGLRVTELEAEVNNRAVFTRRANFSAEDFPLLEYRLIGQNPVTLVYFIWRTADNPGETNYVVLPRSGDGSLIHKLTESAAWQGTITEVGLDIYGDLRGEPLSIDHVSLLPLSHLAILRGAWTKWMDFEPWDQYSINHLSVGHQSGLSSPVLVLAISCGTGIFFLYVYGSFRSKSFRAASIIVVLLGWLALDLLWQKRLVAQNEETRTLFYGKSLTERHMADYDAAVYSYAQHLKRNVLPEPGAKIYLLREKVENEPHNHERIKLQFYLLPHNVFNFWEVPDTRWTAPNEYILAYGDIPGLEYFPERGLLQWGASNTVPVELVDDAPEGAVYKIIKSNQRHE